MTIGSARPHKEGHKEARGYERESFGNHCRKNKLEPRNRDHICRHIIYRVCSGFPLAGFIRFALCQKESGEIRSVWEQRAFITIVLALIYGNIVYQLCRLGFLYRDRKQARRTGRDTSKLFSGYAPDVTILVPTYKKELKTIYQTLMSAVLQQYPDKRVVLLLDDPPYPDNIHDKEKLEASRELVYEISSFLSEPWLRYYESREKCLRRLEKNITGLTDEAIALAACYDDAAAVLGGFAASYAVTDHTDYLFVQKILRDPAKNFRRIARSLKNRAAFPSTCPGIEELLNKYNVLTGTFSAEISFFERKRYENLSHEKNKAMNLNSYIGLIGKDFHEEIRGGRYYLRECSPAFANFSVPDADFIVTLDADSLILPDYTARLVDVMMRPENEKLAVVQTPYSAIPGTDNVLERVAGSHNRYPVSDPSGLYRLRRDLLGWCQCFAAQGRS